MKTRTAPMFLSALAGLSVLAASTLNLTAQISVAPHNATTASATQPATVHLSPGVSDVLKLANAHVSEDTILAYVANSGKTYNLTVNEIVYLRAQGLSDHVLTAMLDQRRKLAEAASQTTQTAPVASQAGYASVGTPQYAPVAVQPSTTYVQTEPAAAPPSSVYVIPSSSTAYAYPSYYWGYPYYGGYYGYGYPGLSLSVGLGLGNGWCGTGWYGGGGYGGYRGYGWYGGGCYGGYRGVGLYGYHGGFGFGCRR